MVEAAPLHCNCLGCPLGRPFFSSIRLATLAACSAPLVPYACSARRLRSCARSCLTHLCDSAWPACIGRRPSFGCARPASPLHTCTCCLACASGTWPAGSPLDLQLYGPRLSIVVPSTTHAATLHSLRPCRTLAPLHARTLAGRQACKRMEMIGPSSAAAILEMATTEELRDVLQSRPILAGRLRTVLLQQPAPHAQGLPAQTPPPHAPQAACAGVPPMLPQAFIVPGFGGQGPVQMPCMFASPPGPPPMPAQPAQPPQASQDTAPQAPDMDEFWDKFSTQEPQAQGAQSPASSGGWHGRRSKDDSWDQWSWNWWLWSDTSTHDWHRHACTACTFCEHRHRG